MLETATIAFFTDSLATTLINSSFSVQKLGHREMEQSGINLDQNPRAHFKSYWWWIGFIIMVLGIIFHLAAVPYVDLTLLAANSSLAILVNLVLSIILFGEKFSFKYDLPAMFFIMGGSVLIVLLSNKKPRDYKGQ